MKKNIKYNNAKPDPVYINVKRMSIFSYRLVLKNYRVALSFCFNSELRPRARRANVDVAIPTSFQNSLIA